MKTIMLMMAIAVAVNCSAAMRNTNGTIPDSVQKSFGQQYPNQHARKWETKNDTCIAIFRMSGKKYWSYFLNNGQWIKTETKITEVTDLPKAVATGFHQSEYQSWYIMDMKHVQSPDQDLFAIRVTRKYAPASYFSEFSQEDKDTHTGIYELYFDKDGSLVKKV